MAKKTLLSMLLVTTFVTTAVLAADNDDPWVAKNPYAGKSYEKEDVSYFAQGVNKFTTVACGAAILAYGAYQVYNNWGTTVWGVSFPQDGAFPVPTSHALTTIGLVGMGEVFVGFPGTVAVTYGTKKAAQGFEFIARHGWKYISYGLHTLNYHWGNFRALHLQGTLFENRHVTYVEKNKQ